MRLDDPEVVRADYADEARLARRVAAMACAEGDSARDVLVSAVAECAPRRILDVGCGMGDLSARIRDDVGAAVVAVDQSPRMVELARARGLDARVADVRALPFGDGMFDCAVAGWVLFHVADVDGALAELARVLRGGGRLVAATNGERHLAELWELVGEPRLETAFSAENGAAALARRFARVERRDVSGVVTFADRAAARDYVASSIVRRHLADALPPFSGPLRVRSRVAVFVAETAW